MLSSHSIVSQTRTRVLRFVGQNKFLGKKYFGFHYMLIINFLGAQRFLGVLPLNASRGYGPVVSSSRTCDEVCWDGAQTRECPDLPVSLMMVVHPLLLECETSMELAASSHCSYLFWSSGESRDEVALSETVPLGLKARSDKGSHTLSPNMEYSSCDCHVGWNVSPQKTGSRTVPSMSSRCLLCPEVAISQRILL